MLRDADGRPGPDGERSLRILYADGLIWNYTERALQARVFDDQGRIARPLDPRALGLSVYPYAAQIHSRTWSEFDGFRGVTFDEGIDGELRTVRAFFPDGSTMQWWIDAERGWSIVRAVRSDASGKVAQESRIALANFDGFWFPSKIECMDTEFHGGLVPRATIRVYAAEINRQDQPARLAPADIGIEPGTLVTVVDSATLRPASANFWDGAALISTEEWSKRLRAGTARPGPTVLREQGRIWANPANRVAEATPDGVIYYREPAAASMPAESDWQKYTREFIARYRLDEDQAQRARQICKDCETERENYRSRRKAEFAAVEDAERAARASGAAAEEWNKLRATRSRLEEPIHAIFDAQLKPRLEKLPTRAQREAAAPGESESRGPESKNSP